MSFSRESKENKAACCVIVYISYCESLILMWRERFLNLSSDEWRLCVRPVRIWLWIRRLLWGFYTAGRSPCGSESSTVWTLASWIHITSTWDWRLRPARILSLISLFLYSFICVSTHKTCSKTFNSSCRSPKLIILIYSDSEIKHFKQLQLHQQF